jgi:uncharacterized membrane protein
LSLDASFHGSSKVDFHSTQHLKHFGPNVKNANDCKKGAGTTPPEENICQKEGHVERKEKGLNFLF